MVFTDVIVAVDQARHNDFVAAIEDLGIFIGDQPLDLLNYLFNYSICNNSPYFSPPFQPALGEDNLT